MGNHHQSPAPFLGCQRFSLLGGAPFLPFWGRAPFPFRVRAFHPSRYAFPFRLRTFYPCFPPPGYALFSPLGTRSFYFFTLWDCAFSLSGTLPPPGTRFPFRLRAFSPHFPHFPPSRYMLLFFIFFPFWDRTFPFGCAPSGYPPLQLLHSSFAWLYL